MRRAPLTRWLALGLLALALLLPALAAARPGGGDSYGGGGGGGGGGGDGIDPGLILYLVLFLIEHPVLGSILLVIGALVYFGNKLAGGSDVNVGHVGRVQASAPQVTPRRRLLDLRASDPAFSVVVLEDFLHLLYGELQRARARGASGRVGPYASPEIVAMLASDPSLERVEGVVIGALRFLGLRQQAGANEVEIEVEANLGEVRGPRTDRLYVVDRFTIRRAVGARSRTPKRLEKLDCPNCGAPFEAVRGNRCGHCQQELGNGRFDWMVSSITRVRHEVRPPLLTGEVEERGTELPTIVDPQAIPSMQQLCARDPVFDNGAFRARAALVFTELNAAWSVRDLSRARAFVSDSIFESFQYWMDVYVGARARNVLEEAVILRFDLANVTTDAYYDAITIRLFARGKDYVVTDEGRVLRGSRTFVRTWSEYWTFVRGHVTGRPTRSDAACPNCGAPIQVDVSGTCAYCHAKITSGDFDWVLSRIEQDEAYRG